MPRPRTAIQSVSAARDCSLWWDVVVVGFVIVIGRLCKIGMVASCGRPSAQRPALRFHAHRREAAPMADTDKRIALLIDAGNAPAAKIDVILAECARHGWLTCAAPATGRAHT